MKKAKITLSGATIFILSIDAVEMASDEWKQYLDIEAMKIVSLPQYDNGLYEEYKKLAEQIEGQNREKIKKY